MAKKKRLSIEDIVQRKDRSITCPQCWDQMRYKRVKGRMAKWSPGPYAWRCEPCSIVVLDGSLDPDEDTWDRKIAEDDRDRLSSYLSSIFREAKKSEPEN